MYSFRGSFSFALTSKLTARGVDVRAEGTADGGTDALLFQRFGESVDGFRGRVGKACFGYFVDGDEVDVDGHGGGKSED